jgi:ribosomal protein S18 acetylase RimI-like enzyme
VQVHRRRHIGEWLYLQRSLAAPPPAVQIPPGFRITDLTEADYASRAQALAQVFGAEPLPQRYQQFMDAPGYDPELDLVLLDSRGEIAAFAMSWLDPVSMVGQFEPVGTVPDFQRQGLGKATLLEGMRRLRARGAENVIVIVDAGEDAARHLYQSVGLEPGWKLHLYAMTPQSL